jgi:uncharacterized repeat protein (TIGR03803 family)
MDMCQLLRQVGPTISSRRRACPKRVSLSGAACAAIMLLLSVPAHGRASGPPTSGPTESIVHTFTGYATDGASPEAGLVKDANGNFYGTTLGGGNNNYHSSSGDGAVFMLTPTGGETVIWNFGGGNDGWGPAFGNLIIDSSGNLYGTTVHGGGGYEAGTVFEVSPNGSGGWSEKVLWSFGAVGDGAYPYARLALDGNGNLYGATTKGGTSDNGIAFELSPDGFGSWMETVLHNFAGSPADGSSPRGVIVDGSGNLYGTTYQGGANNFGTAFKLSPPAVAGNSWIEKIVWNFGSGLDGKLPIGSLIIDGSGNLYGTTQAGGAYNAIGTAACCGSAYKLTPQSGGTWAETILWSFGNPKKKGDGQLPTAGPLMDVAGNLYGTCSGSGANGLGTAFKLVKPTSGSTWSETILWSFAGVADGSHPSSDLVMDGSGSLYGTTHGGGASQDGILFKITP